MLNNRPLLRLNPGSIYLGVILGCKSTLVKAVTCPRFFSVVVGVPSNGVRSFSPDETLSFFLSINSDIFTRYMSYKKIPLVLKEYNRLRKNIERDTKTENLVLVSECQTA